MSLTESIVENAALIMPVANLTRLLLAAISAALRFPVGEEWNWAMRSGTGHRSRPVNMPEAPLNTSELLT